MRLLGAEVLAIATNLDEVEVALDVCVLLRQIAIGGTDVVRHEVAWLEVHFFQEEGVTGRELLDRCPTVEQVDRLLGTTVDGVHQVEGMQAKVIVGARLDKELLNGTRCRIASRADEHRRGRLVRQHIDGVLRGRRDELSVGSREIDAVETLLFDGESGSQRPVFGYVEIKPLLIVIVEHKLPGGRSHCRNCTHPDLRPVEHGDIATLLNQPGF